MRRLLLTALFAAASMLPQSTSEAHGPEVPAGQEHAGETMEHGEAHEDARMPNEIWWKLANFAILAGGLGYLASKYAGPYFRERGEGIRSGIAEAAAIRADAEARAAEIERRIGNLSGELENLRAKSSEEIAAEGARLQAETGTQIAKIQARAEMEIASAGKNARLELKAYSAQLALETAERQIRQEMNPATQNELADAFIHDLRGEGHARAGEPVRSGERIQ